MLLQMDQSGGAVPLSELSRGSYNTVTTALEHDNSLICTGAPQCDLWSGEAGDAHPGRELSVLPTGGDRGAVVSQHSVPPVQ